MDVLIIREERGGKEVGMFTLHIRDGQQQPPPRRLLKWTGERSISEMKTLRFFNLVLHSKLLPELKSFMPALAFRHARARVRACMCVYVHVRKPAPCSYVDVAAAV